MNPAERSFSFPPRRTAPHPRLGLAAAALLGLSACWPPAPVPKPDGGTWSWDVRGNYALTFDDRLTVKLWLGGVERVATADGRGRVDFGTVDGKPLTLDLKPFCDRPEVKCPSELLWPRVAVDQRDVARPLDLHVIDVVDDTRHDLPPGQRAASVGGLVDHRDSDRFLVGLGATGGAAAGCALLGLSAAGGRFSRRGERVEVVYRDGRGGPCSLDGGAGRDGGPGDGGASHDCRAVTTVRAPLGAEVVGVADGKVTTVWAAGCAWPSANLAAAASLTFETGFSGRRSGPFDPPPFVPVDPVPTDGGSPPAERPDGGAGGG